MATTSEMTVMFFPGLSGTTTRGTGTSRMVVSSRDETAAVAVLGGLPVLQLHHHLDPLLLAHGAYAEQRRNVDQANAPDLHMMRCQLVSPADQHIVASTSHLHHVVGDEAVPPLHQIQHALALADAGAADEEQSHAVHVGQ